MMNDTAGLVEFAALGQRRPPAASNRRAPSLPNLPLGTRRILAIDDEDMCEVLRAGLRERGFDVEVATTCARGLSMLSSSEFDAVVADAGLADGGGLSLCRQIVRDQEGDLPVLMTAYDDMETAVEAIRAGAQDFIPKPLTVDVVSLSLKRALQHRALRRTVVQLSRSLEEVQPVQGLIGESRAMQRVYGLIDRVAPSDTTVLITGESGTGKELVARAIHARSGRAAGRFVALNCAAVPAALLESELFGHAKGAFTDAKTAKQGLFVQASGGTLLLDEVGEMPLSMQAKLLRVLQERKVRPVGGEDERELDVRIIAATNRNLERDVETKRFREDLYYRINVVSIYVPPLQAHKGDLLLLAQHFLEQAAYRIGRDVRGISAATAEKLTSYDWPGNVRELENTIERAVALTSFEEITPECLPDRIRERASTGMIINGSEPSELPTLQEAEHRYICQVLEAVSGNKSRAARLLGIERRGLYRRLRSSGVRGA